MMFPINEYLVESEMAYRRERAARDYRPVRRRPRRRRHGWTRSAS